MVFCIYWLLWQTLNDHFIGDIVEKTIASHDYQVVVFYFVLEVGGVVRQLIVSTALVWVVKFILLLGRSEYQIIRRSVCIHCLASDEHVATVTQIKTV